MWVWFNLHMVKQTTQSKQSKLPLIALIIALVSLVGVIATALMAGSYISSQYAMMDSNAEVRMQETMKLARLELCYAENIHPCDQDAINKFYDAHPEK